MEIETAFMTSNLRSSRSSTLLQITIMPCSKTIRPKSARTLETNSQLPVSGKASFIVVLPDEVINPAVAKKDLADAR